MPDHVHALADLLPSVMSTLEALRQSGDLSMGEHPCCWQSRIAGHRLCAMSADAQSRDFVLIPDAACHTKPSPDGCPWFCIMQSQWHGPWL